MDYFPAFLELADRPCLLVGGGSIAARKARLLLAAGASLTVVSPDVCDELAEARDAGRIRHLARRFKARDIDGHWLVVSATGVPAVERVVYRLASEQRVFCNAVDDKASCSFITPAIVDRSPLMVAISSGGSAPVLARRVRAKIETLLPSDLGELARAADRWRDRVKARFSGFTDRLRFWEQFFDQPFAEHGNAEARLAQMVAAHQPETAGEAWLVGAGPGDPELLTLKALQCLQAADVIVHDRLVSDAILNLARRDADRISVGKVVGCKLNSQEDINALLVRLVAEGKRVCRLKGGDPFIFGRGGEEAEALDAAGLSWRAVPGITAAAGCAAASGIPLTHREVAQSVVLVTAHGKQSIDTLDWPSLARDRQTLAVYMGVARYPELSSLLIRHGRPPTTPVAIIENGTTPEQRVIRGTLGQLTLLAKAHAVRAPAILLIGDVANRGAAYAESPIPADFPATQTAVSA
ncbi:MAG: siroheme synthase CysG [Pseudomonadota bacterium]